MTFFVRAGNTGDIDGTATSILGGTVLDMSALADDFSGSTVSPIWTPTTSGGARIIPAPTVGALRMDTGFGAAATASLLSTYTAAYVDFAVTQNLVSTSVPDNGTVETEVFLRVGATTRARAQLVLSKTQLLLVVTVTIPGVTIFSYSRDVSRSLGAPITLRWQKASQAGVAVQLFFNSESVMTVPWIASAAAFGFSVLNSVVGSRVATDWTAYQAWPVILFGEVPSAQLLDVRTERVTADVPPARVPGPVNLTAYGDGVNETITDGYTYTALGRRTVGRTSTQRLSDLERL